jgi:hypothetical protein
VGGHQEVSEGDMMGDYWKKKYDEILDFLKEKYGAGWVLCLLEEVEATKRK